MTDSPRERRLAAGRAEERWLPVVGYEGFYQVSDLGRVRSLDRMVAGKYGNLACSPGRVLLQDRNRHGRRQYLRVRLSRNGKVRAHFVHVLVLEAFIGPRPPGCECCHANGDGGQNFLGNLRWGTKKENARDRDLHGATPRGERQGSSKLTGQAVVSMRRLRRDGWSFGKIGRLYGVTKDAARSAVIGQTWRHIAQESQDERPSLL